jgi:hypothetical protein
MPDHIKSGETSSFLEADAGAALKALKKARNALTEQMEVHGCLNVVPRNLRGSM